MGAVPGGVVSLTGSGRSRSNAAMASTTRPPSSIDSISSHRLEVAERCAVSVVAVAESPATAEAPRAPVASVVSGVDGPGTTSATTFEVVVLSSVALTAKPATAVSAGSRAINHLVFGGLYGGLRVVSVTQGSVADSLPADYRETITLRVVVTTLPPLST